MKQLNISHFSKKVFIFSLVFALANVGIISLRVLSADNSGQQQEVTPVVRITGADSAELQSAFEDAYLEASDKQSLYSGSSLRTGISGSAQIEIGNNLIRLNENTEVKVLESYLGAYSNFENKLPRLSLELVSGSIWIDAFDLIEVKTPRVVSRFDRSVGSVNYLNGSNKIIALTNDVDIELLNESGVSLSRYNLPLQNQVSFFDAQLVDLYSSLKPSKLRKELKMTTVPQDVLDNPWVQANIEKIAEKDQAFSDQFIYSSASYTLKKQLYGLQSLFNFTDSNASTLLSEQLELNLFYLLGEVDSSNDLELTTQLIDEIDSLLATWPEDDVENDLLLKALDYVESASFGSPQYQLRDYLIDQISASKGGSVYRIYLTDFRKFLLSQELERGLSVLRRWEKAWKTPSIESDFLEYERQSQILNHTILSLSDQVNIAVLNHFDTTGLNRIELSQDPSETRFEVTQERLEIASRLIADYRYSLAKQYLRQSYLGLDISESDEGTPSSEIFLEKGRLLAQRIEYAENVLNGAAKAIDETKFREYFQARTEEEQLSSNLESFLEIESSTPSQEVDTVDLFVKMTDRFIQAGVALDLSQVVLMSGSDSIYSIKAARLNQRDSEGRLISFDATYDARLDALSDVSFGDQSYKGPFLLEDLILLLTSEDLSQSVLHQNSVDVGTLLSTDQEQAEATREQALAQDLAIKLAVSQLLEQSVVVQNVKDDIKVTDPLNLDKFRVENALLLQGDAPALEISFNFYSSISRVTEVRSSDGVLLLSDVAIEELQSSISERLNDLENEIELVANFSVFALQNELEISDENIIYTPEGYLLLNDLKLLTIDQSVSGLYDFESDQFLTVSNPLASAENIALKAYFKQLTNAYVKSLLEVAGLDISSRQIESAYPFRDIILRNVEVDGVSFDFTFDPLDGRIDEVSYLEGQETILVEELLLSLDDLKSFAESLVLESEENTEESVEVLSDNADSL